MRKMFKKFLSLFKQSEPIQVQEPVEVSRVATSKRKIGLIVGHNSMKQGAANYKGEGEYSYYSRLAPVIAKRLIRENIEVYIIKRPALRSYNSQCERVANRAEQIGLNFAICLHFNSAGKGARGCEVLTVDPYSKKTNAVKFADLYTDLLNKEQGFRERGIDGVKLVKSGHNGFGMLHALDRRGVDACIIEPCFANHQTFESEYIFENEYAHADVIARAIAKTL